MNLNKATLAKKTSLTYDVIKLCFSVSTTADSEPFIHKAGQFVSVKVPSSAQSATSAQTQTSSIFRSYSISSRPTPGYFELCVKVVENGLASNFLANLKEESEVEFLGPIGNFGFKEQAQSQPQTQPEDQLNTKNHLSLFIATGTGIAPLKSMIEDELAKGNQQKMHLLFGVRYIKDIFYKEFFEKLAAKYKNFTFDLTLSRPENESWEKEGGKIGRVTDLLKTLELDPKTTTAYICGLKDMVEETTKILQQKGLLPEAIHFERFN